MDFNKEKLQSELFRDAGQYKDFPYFSSSKYRQAANKYKHIG